MGVYQVAAQAGLPSEGAATQGINQLLASSMLKGTATHSASEIALALESPGASLSAATGNNARHGITADALERVLATALSGVALQQQSLSASARQGARSVVRPLGRNAPPATGYLSKARCQPHR